MNSNTFEVDGAQYQFEPVDPEAPNWEVQLNGEIITDRVKTLAVVNRGMGIAGLYALNPGAPAKDSSDPQNAKRRYGMLGLVNRGGTVIAPTIEANDELWPFVLDQGRFMVGKSSIQEFPRGQALFGEKPIDTARRELLEEMGLDIPLANLEYLGSGNPDTALIYGANVHAFQLRLPEEFVIWQDERPALRPDIKGNPNSRTLEQILRSHSVSEDEFNTPSMMTAWAFGLVLQRIRAEERANRKPWRQKPA